MFLCLVIIVTNWSCTSYRVEKDLDILCEAASTVNQDTSLSKKEKITELAKITSPLASLDITQNLLWFLIEEENPTYSVIDGKEGFLTYVKIEDWSCEALETLLESEL